MNRKIISNARSKILILIIIKLFCNIRNISNPRDVDVKNLIISSASLSISFQYLLQKMHLHFAVIIYGFFLSRFWSKHKNMFWKIYTYMIIIRTHLLTEILKQVHYVRLKTREMNLLNRMMKLKIKSALRLLRTYITSNLRIERKEIAMQKVVGMKQ